MGRTTIAPHSNWQGDYEIGTTALGYSTSNCQSGDCPVIQWPGGQENADGLAVTHSAVDTWWGSLITEKTDASGLKYMRNRYYNPQTAQFTQQDPIGLSGGMNLYGFAGGDPVNFSDPFGLCPLCIAAGVFLEETVRGAVVGAIVGAAEQAAINNIRRRPTFENVGRTAFMGAGIGAVTGGLSSAIRIGRAVGLARSATAVDDIAVATRAEAEAAGELHVGSNRVNMLERNRGK